MLKLLISYAIPDIPSWVATEMAKIEFHRREIEKATSFSIIQSNAVVPSIAQSLETDDKSVQVTFFFIYISDYLYLPIIGNG